MDRHDWNRRYAGRDLLWTDEPNRFLVEQVSDLIPGRALDLGAGEGRNAVWLSERGWRVEAVDFSGVALDKGRRLAEARNVDVRWTLGDLATYTPEQRGFDLVLLLYLHLPRTGMETVIHRAEGAVANSGTFLLVGHDRRNLTAGYGGPRDPGVLYSAEDVVAALHELRVVEAGTRKRPVSSPTGEQVALDCLVRACRGA